jgi:hypothetical protein
MRCSEQTRILVSKAAGVVVLLMGFMLAARLCFGAQVDSSKSPNIFKPESTPADSIFHLSLLVLAITGVVFLLVFSLIVYAIVKYRRRDGGDLQRLCRAALDHIAAVAQTAAESTWGHHTAEKVLFSSSRHPLLNGDEACAYPTSSLT